MAPISVPKLIDTVTSHLFVGARATSWLLGDEAIACMAYLA